MILMCQAKCQNTAHQPALSPRAHVFVFFGSEQLVNKLLTFQHQLVVSMMGNRKRNRRDTQTASRGGNEPEVGIRSGGGPRKDASRSYLSACGCKLSLVTARSMVSSPTSRACGKSTVQKGLAPASKGRALRMGNPTHPRSCRLPLVQCASISAWESAPRRSGPRRHARAGCLGVVVQTKSAAFALGAPDTFSEAWRLGSHQSRKTLPCDEEYTLS